MNLFSFKNLTLATILGLAPVSLVWAQSSANASIVEALPGQTEISLSASPETLAATKDAFLKQQAANEKEIQDCEKIGVEEDRLLCLKEARASQAMNQQEKGPSVQTLERNAMLRCDKLTGQDKASCQARMLGYGKAEGSVAEGGIIREINTKYMAGRGAITVLPLNSK